MAGYIDRIIISFMLLSGGTTVPPCVYGQKLLHCSEEKKPDWMVHARPEPTDNTFEYIVAEGEHGSLAEAREACLIDLTTYIRQTFRVEKNIKTDIRFGNRGKESQEEMNMVFKFDIQNESLRITACKKDEYWEYWLDPDGQRKYRCYALYAVAKTAGNVRFDELRFDTRYGGRGLWRSALIPGWGQFYKGNNIRGACMLGGGILLGGGIILGENLRMDYIRKAQQTLNVSFRRDYISRADNWKNVRNVCIGGAVALYVYNLVDAIVAPGRKRTTVQRHLSLNPAVGYTGITLGYNFK